jgi:hypothetical protein
VALSKESSAAAAMPFRRLSRTWEKAEEQEVNKS